MKLACLILLACLVAQYACFDTRVLTDEYIAELNAKATTWTAKRNFPIDTPVEKLRKLASLIGVHPNPDFSLPIKKHEVRTEGIPDSFDSREIWPFCESIRSIRNQGACGSCWAFGAVESMSDRICIFSAGSQKFTFSPEELVSCCTDCGNGCNGGFLLQSWQYWVNNGIPSGGDEGSNEGCRPYTSASNAQTPECNKRCVSSYGKEYNNDIRKGIAAYQVTNTVEQIQHEIVINGPVEAMFEVFEDFYNYGSGVYQYTSGNSVGYHAIKIIGWGEENGVPYWLISNSWGTGFGNDGGFFKMIRGQNHVQIESNIVAGIPQL